MHLDDTNRDVHHKKHLAGSMCLIFTYYIHTSHVSRSLRAPPAVSRPTRIQKPLSRPCPSTSAAIRPRETSIHTHTYTYTHKEATCTKSYQPGQEFPSQCITRAVKHIMECRKLMEERDAWPRRVSKHDSARGRCWREKTQQHRQKKGGILDRTDEIEQHSQSHNFT